MSPVFDAVEALARKYNNDTMVKVASRLCARAAIRRSEIEEYRSYRQLIRHNCEGKAGINGRLAMLEMHPLEAEAIRLLCPEFMAPNSEQQKRGLRWVEKQPWAKEFLPAPIEKVRF